MDLSKLPKLSQTTKAEEARASETEPVPAQPADEPKPEPLPYSRQTAPMPGTGAEIWISLVVAVIFLMLGANYGRYLIATISHRPFHTNVTWETPERAGQEVGYFDLTGFTALDEMARFYFGVALIFEAIMLFAVSLNLRAKVGIVYLAFFVAVAATALNIYAAGKLFGFGITPLIQVLAIGFGGYMAFYEWALLQYLRRVEK